MEMKNCNDVNDKQVKADPLTSLANFRRGVIHEYQYAYLCSVGQIMHYVYVMYK